MTLRRNTARFVLTYLNRPFSSTVTFPGKHNQQNYFLAPKRFKSTCWKCGKEQSSPKIFCAACHAVQAPLERDNYFKVFDLEEKFNIDQRDLRNKFRGMQSLLHPDKFSNKTEEEQRISADFSSLLNKAYSGLQAPLRRAEHLLNLRGERIGEDQGLEDPVFLMEVMELNEEMENAGEDKERLKRLNAKNKVELERICREIDECFKRNDVPAAKRNVVKLKYFSSLGNRINGMLRELGETD